MGMGSMEVFKLSDRISLLPVIHGSGDSAIATRRVLLEHSFSCLAVPIPPSFQSDVESAVNQLPTCSVVSQPATHKWKAQDWLQDHEDREENDEDNAPERSYVPVDPCQPVIAAIRFALGENIPIRFIDQETPRYVPHVANLPDPYALKHASLERVSAAVLTSLTRPKSSAILSRFAHMGKRLVELEREHKSILALVSVVDWPWVREACQIAAAAGKGAPEVIDSGQDWVPLPTEIHQVTDKTLTFMLGELPFITALYERARAELDDDENLSIDGVKDLLLTARDRYYSEFRKRARKVTPNLLKSTLRYARNLTLTDCRLTPDLYTLVLATKQVAGDQYALHVAETAREYIKAEYEWPDRIAMGIDQARIVASTDPTIASEDVFKMVSRLPIGPRMWRSCGIRRRPEKTERREWSIKWNPFSQCSWPPEDKAIEGFRAHVFQKAKSIMGVELARTEKFTTSILDGIDIRDTLRNWHTGDLYVKILPPSKGRMDAAIMLFDSPADPRDYPYRVTWHSEFEWESTLAFFATNPSKEPVGPGIRLATYGGAMFIFPSIYMPEIWQNPRFDFVDTLEERLVAATCAYATCPHVAILCHTPPGSGWKKLAAKYKKKLVHVPMGQFSDATVQQLRMFHVLNGKKVRSYAADFIRKA